MTSFQSRLDRLNLAAPSPLRDAARLIFLHDVLSTVPELAGLLAAAKEMNVPIRFNAEMEKGTNGTYSHNPAVIELNPDVPTERLVGTLIHEMRHMWQFHMMGYVGREFLLPHERLIFNRIFEGDAFAYTSVMLHKVNRAAGLTIDVRDDHWAREMDDFYSARQKTCRRLSRVFKAFQKSKNARDYYDRKEIDIEYYPSIENGRHVYPGVQDLYQNLQKLQSAGGMVPGFCYLRAAHFNDLARKVRHYVPKKLYREAVAKSRALIKAQRHP